MLNRLTLLLSLLGMVLTLHLWVQKERNFDRGCWGIGSGAQVAANTSCRAEALQKASQLFNVSIANWGYGFYFLVGSLSFAKILLPPAASRRCHAASEIAVAVAFPFSCYLFYFQAFVARAFCPLCLLSGGLVTALFCLHAVAYGRGGDEPIPDSARTVELGYASGMLFVATGLLAALMIMVNHVGTRRLEEGEDARQFVAMVGRALPTFIEPARLQEMKPAAFDRSVPPLDTQAWLASNPPALGTPGKVTVVTFLDPNCPGCSQEFQALKRLAGRFQDRAAFYVFSRVLWDYSLLQSQALELARQDGRYFEMWELQFTRQKHRGMTPAEVEDLFTALGTDRRNLSDRLASARSTVLEQRDRAIKAGINSTPTVFINGRAVEFRSTDEPSLARLIEQAAAPNPRTVAN